MPTYRQDHTLPPLPIPALPDTCRELEALVGPLVGGAALTAFSRLLNEFQENQGPRLQALLRDWADAAFGNQSWLRPIWDDLYLSSRGRLPVDLNYNFRLVRGRWGRAGLPALMAALARVIDALAAGRLPAESGKGGFLSMDMLAGMIYTRIPGHVRDTCYHPPLAISRAASVVCRGHWFILSLVDEAGAFVSPGAIEAALREIRALAAAAGPCAPVGVMTCAPRMQAAALRDLVQQHPGNRMNLERIERTLFTVCLDEPPSGRPFNLGLIAGPPENRWSDKSLQIIADGADIGISLEHAGCDAGIWMYLLDQAEALLSAGPPAGAGGAHLRALSWHLSDGCARALAAEADEFARLTAVLSLADRRMPALSKEALKAKGCSPDSFVQLLFQAAYHKLTGRVRSVYESVSTRVFYQGRTECMRPVTAESAAFVAALAAGTGGEALAGLFHAAARAHHARLARVQCALGAERHMSGLAVIAQIEGLPLPEVFSSEGYRALRHDALSTSSTTTPLIDFFSFGPVVPDGIGIGYGIKPEGLHVSVCASEKSGVDPARFLDAMEEAATVMLGL